MEAFDSLFCLEETFYKEGYELGLADGKRAGLIEGRLTGLERGFEKFAQMGRLHGRCVVWAGRLPNRRSRGIGSGLSGHPTSGASEEGEKMVAGEEQEEVKDGGEEEGGGGGGGGEGGGEGGGKKESSDKTNDASATEVDQKQTSNLPPSFHPNPNNHIPPSPSPPTSPRILSTSKNNKNNNNNNPDIRRLQKHILTLYALVEPASLSIQNTEEAVSDFDDRLRRAEGKVKIIERIGGEGEGVESERDKKKKKKSGGEGIEDLGKAVLGSGKVRF